MLDLARYYFGNIILYGYANSSATDNLDFGLCCKQFFNI